MLLQKISITNFRQYKGTTEIIFSTDADRNVTVIMGENGTGKTTLAQAFMWVLYGETDFKVKELLNRDLRDNMIPGDEQQVKVELVVQDDVGKYYHIVRRQKYVCKQKRVDKGELTFTVRYKDENGQMQSMDERPSRLFIKKTLPKELSQFFIFDGERVRVMIEEIENGKSRQFAEAVHGLIGLTAMRNTIDHFRPSGTGTTVTKKYERQLNESAGDRAESYAKEIEDLEKEKQKKEQELAEKEPQIKKYQEAALNYKQKLEAIMPQIQLKREYSQMLEMLASEEEQRFLKITSLLQEFNKNAKYYFAQPFYELALKELKGAGELDKGIPGIRKNTIKHLLERRQCLCGKHFEMEDPEYKALMELLDFVPPKNLGQAISDYKKAVWQGTKEAEGFAGSIKVRLKDISNSDVKRSELIQNISETYEELTSEDNAKFYRKEIEENENKAKILKAQCDGCLIKIGEYQKDIGYKQSQKDKLILQEESNKKFRRYYEYAKYIYELLDKEYGAKEKQAREKLQDTINHIFQEIYDGGIRLEVDERYNIQVKVSDVLSSEDELERNTAQNYAIIFAFISGIIKMAKDKKSEDDDLFGEEMNLSSKESYDGYPLVMDAPLSAFDKKRIQSICDTIPGIAKQVIIFIKDTDGDVAEEHMSAKIGKKYILLADSQTTTHVEVR